MIIIPALKLLAVATLLPMPSDTPPARRVAPPAPRELRAVEDVVLTARMADGANAPATIVLPQLKNRADIMNYIRANYPDSSVAEPTVIPVAWVYIDEDGKAHKPEIIVPSGSLRHDSLAVAAIGRAQFAPALVESKAVPIWVMLPVQLRAASVRAPGPCDLEKGPCFTPYTTKPELQNRNDVARALVQNYPADLRQRGISGTIQLWVRVNNEGRVVDARVKESSGHIAMDEAAVKVAKIMVFSPARHREVPVPVWIALPVVFRAR